MSWEENKDVLAAQNDWINAQLKAWQVAWHDAFDRDAALLATRSSTGTMCCPKTCVRTFA